MQWPHFFEKCGHCTLTAFALFSFEALNQVQVEFFADL